MKKFLLFVLLLIGSFADSGETVERAQGITTSLSAAQESAFTNSGEKRKFEAEVSRLMEIIINSLYKTRDIFLRELISNANDAIDKIRYQSLTNQDALKAKPELEIKVQTDQTKGTLTVLDSGIGMTKAELEKNLGTVAHSGTASFLDKFAEAQKEGVDPMSLIGQFGVGFYSTFLVADTVTVISKSNDDDQYIWRSTADGSYSVTKDPNGNTLGRGTAVILTIKEDAVNFLEPNEVEKVVQRYSQFIQYPIYLYANRTEMADLEMDDDDDDDEGAAKGDDDLTVEDDDAEKEKKKQVEVQIPYWKRLNENKPIWSRRPGNIEKDEYHRFYKALSRNSDDPISYTHFRAEGEIEFNSILFVPHKAPAGFYENYYSRKSKMKLYVRRVLVADEFEDITPRYLNFLQGLVDSNDLPLNVNREDLQKSKVMTLISRKLTRKALDMLKKLAAEDEEEEEEVVDDDDDEEGGGKEKEPKDEEEEKKVAKESRYLNFWNEFGKSIKLGYMEDNRNKKRLLELLRFPSSKSEDVPTSLAEYVKRMATGQKYIYTLSSASIDEAKNSPFMERLNAKGFEVLFFVDNLDEYLNLKEYEDIEFQSITKDGTEIDGEKMKNFLKEKEEEFDDLKTWLKGVYGSKVSKIQVASALKDTPMAIGTGKHGYSARMYKIANAQAFGRGKQSVTKILQINYRHPIILEMKSRVDAGSAENDEELADLANLMLDVAMVSSGFDIESKEQGDFSERVYRVVSKGLSVSPDATLLEEPEFANAIDPVDQEIEEDDEEEEDEAELEEEEDKEEL